MTWRCKPGFILVCLCFWFCLSIGHAVDLPDMPVRYVVDLADMIDSGTEEQLNGYLQELEQKTTAQMIVLTIKSLEGESLQRFAITTAHDKWRLGQAGKDNGLLLLVAKDDRKYRIETGYGLEGVIPDSFAGEVGRTYMAPYFKNSEYSKGILAGALVLANAIAADAGVTITGMPKVPGANKTPSSAFNKIVSVLFLIFIAYMFIRHPRTFLTLLLLSTMGGGRRGGGWGGGGGFGGFGGGGGGGFGGGGASGGW